MVVDLATFLVGLGLAFGQLFFGLVLSLASVYIGLKAFDRMTVGIDEMKELKRGNVAVGILMMAVIFSIATVVQSGVSGLAAAVSGKTLAQLPMAVAIGILQLLIGLGAAVVSVYLCIRVLDIITVEIDEMKELKKGNVAVAIMMGGILISVAFVVQAGISGISTVLGSLI
ncbi:MAG: DUF350 domain-containing protein [archaeon]